MPNYENKINKPWLDQERRTWNVDSLHEAMFGRIYTDTRILKLPREEQIKEWYDVSLESMHQILEGIPFQGEWKLLEIGCGIGRVIKPLRHIFSQVDGVDIAEKMVEFSRDYLTGLPGKGTVYLNNGYDLSMIKDNTYDYVYSMITFQHIRSISVVKSYLSEIWRVLKPDGFFKIQVYDKSNPGMGNAYEEAAEGVQYGMMGNGYSEQELNSLLVEHGFGSIDISHVKTWIWGVSRKASKPEHKHSFFETASRPVTNISLQEPAEYISPHLDVGKFMGRITDMVENQDYENAVIKYQAERPEYPDTYDMSEFDKLMGTLIEKLNHIKKKT